jgi:hypothetical protein
MNYTFKALMAVAVGATDETFVAFYSTLHLLDIKDQSEVFFFFTILKWFFKI